MNAVNCMDMLTGTWVIHVYCLDYDGNPIHAGETTSEQEIGFLVENDEHRGLLQSTWKVI